MREGDSASDSESTKDPLSSSCYAEIRLDKIKVEDMSDDEELTSLAWLQDTDLLKNISCASPIDETKENGSGPLSHPPHVPYNPQKHINSKPPYSFSCLIFMAIEDSPIKKLPVKDIYNWILTHFPYFQNAPTGWKNSVRHNLSLNKCFKKVEKEKAQGIGKGSLWCIDPDYRPNLLQALRKTPYHPYHQLQMLSNPQPTANYTLHGVFTGGSRPLPLTPRLNINSPSPHLFPFLSRRLNQTKLEDTNDIDVANTLVSLKRAAESRRPLQCQNGRRSRSPSPPEFGSEREKQLLLKHKLNRASRPVIVCTSNPSEDHTYSITEAHIRQSQSPRSSIDEEYDFGPDDSDVESWDSEEDMEQGSEGDSPRYRPTTTTVRPSSSSLHSSSKKWMSSVHDEEEKKKIVEGADALLNLANLATAAASIVPLPSVSPNSNNNNNNIVKIKQEPKDEEEDMETDS